MVISRHLSTASREQRGDRRKVEEEKIDGINVLPRELD